MTASGKEGVRHWVGLAAYLFGVATGCGDGSAPLPAPDPILRDSLGVTDASQVAEVALRQGDGVEVVEPDTLRIGSVRFASFRSDDHWPRRVRFLLDGVPSGGREFLRRAGAVESPPLVHAGARWVVEVTDAPAGVYPFVVVGPRSPGRGVLVVDPPPAR